MAKFMCTHTIKGITREQFCQVAEASQQDPNVKGIHSYANLAEGKIFCVWQAPEADAVAAWFKKMNVPYDTIVKLDVEGAGGSVQAV